MRHLYMLIFTILIYSSCAGKKTENSNISKNDSIQIKISNTDNPVEFLGLFKDIKPDGLHIYPPEYRNRKLVQSPYGGIAVDVKKFTYLDDYKIFFDCCKIFAIGKFEINDKYIGLLIRRHSQYDESLIELLLWNKSERKIIEGLDLADSFGDEGWYFDTESWITEYEFNKKLIIISRRKDSHPNENYTSATITDSFKISDFDGLKFKTVKTNQIDTTNYKLKVWKNAGL